jgi:hypothetical protein
VPHGAILGVADRFRDDDGSADPAVTAALGAFAAGTGGEHATLLALAGARLLVPVVAELTAGPPGAGPAAASAADGGAADGGTTDGGTGRPAARPGGGEKSSDMSLPTLVGHDGRRALPVFTSLESLARWRPSARPMPADAARVWLAAAQDSGAVVIDVAGPVPLAVEGARLAALAAGEPVPLPEQDPDVRAAVEAALGAAAAGIPVRFALRPGVDGGDLLIELSLDQRDGAEALAARVGSAVLERLGSRLRRGVALALRPQPGHPG